MHLFMLNSGVQAKSLLAQLAPPSVSNEGVWDLKSLSLIVIIIKLYPIKKIQWFTVLVEGNPLLGLLVIQLNWMS